MNFIFISPQFPKVYYNFCRCLRENGATVLGIGDTPYDNLEQNVRDSLNEYYYVPNMEDYDQMYRAVAFYAFKYGRIDWIESNNEYWLPTDAQLRTDFNVTTGVHTGKMNEWNHKSLMKKYYAEAGVPTARCIRVKDYDSALEFANLVGFPLFVKPDHGVGAEDSWKLSDMDDFNNFFEIKPDVPYVMEEFVTGDIYSYDAITDSKGNVLFENSAVFPPSIADLVNQGIGLNYHCLPDVPAQLRQRGRATLRAFGVKSRFTHFEFFRLTKAKPGLGEVGDFVGLEVNMRPAGGYTPDMMDYAHSLDVYKIWADMVCFDCRTFPESEDQYYCAYASRKDCNTYKRSHKEIVRRYDRVMVMCERMPDALSGAMGNQMYTVRLKTLAEVEEFYKFVGELA